MILVYLIYFPRIQFPTLYIAHKMGQKQAYLKEAIILAQCQIAQTTNSKFTLFKTNQWSNLW